MKVFFFKLTFSTILGVITLTLTESCVYEMKIVNKLFYIDVLIVLDQ